MTDTILITGMSGLIGRLLGAHLKGQAELSALNRSAIDGVPTTRADIADYEAIRPAFDNIDTVVHLAAKAGEGFTWEELRDTNVEGTRNVLHAAAEAGCARVVFASSGTTVSGWERVEPYASLVSGRYDDAPDRWQMVGVDSTRPSGVYGSTKVWGEALGRHYADTTDLSVISMRIGYVNAEDRPNSDRAYSVWCSQRDIVDALARAIRLDAGVSCETCFANSANKWGYRDLEHSREVLGFEPRDNAEDHR